MPVDRRHFLKAAAAGAAASALPARIYAQTPRKVTFMQAWLPDGSNMFIYAAKNRGLYRKRGIDLEISRGFGSVAASQAVGSGKFDFGMAAVAAGVQQTAKGLDVVHMGTAHYDSTMGIAVLADSPIKTPKDLEGRKLGMVPGSMAHILWPSFAKATGVDASKVQIVNWDFRSYYGIFGAKQVDASGNFTLGSTGQWLFKRKGETVRQFVFSDYLPILGSGVAVRTDTLQNDPDTVKRFVRATQRAWTYLATEPKKAVPEAAAIVHKTFDELPPAAVIAEYAYEMVPDRMVSPVTRGKPVGWSSPADWEKMVELLKAHDASMTRTPPAAELMTNDYLSP
jgi:ABC-type nitrate/sulfonate/bicarbonate transport system substrate-binding protein